MAQVEGLNLRGSRWYVRIIIPDDLRSTYGKARINIARLGEPKLIDQFARLVFADRDRGKVKFLAALGCINDEQAAFLRRLGRR